MPEAPTYAVTGATGQVGGRVAARLAEEGVPQRIVVRDAARAPELPAAQVAQASYGDKEAMRSALEGVHSLFLVSAAEAPDRHAGLRGHDAVHRAGDQRQLEAVGVDLPGDRDVLGVARAPGGHDGDVVEGIGPAAPLATADLDLSHPDRLPSRTTPL